MQQSPEIGEIATALARAQGAMKPASKDSKNPFLKSKYADLSSIWESVREPFSSNGLSILQNPIMVEGGIAVETQINHASGQWFRFDPYVIPVDKDNAQGIGSATTYAKRYSLSAAAGVSCDDDDDGEAAKLAAKPAKRLSLLDDAPEQSASAPAADQPVVDAPASPCTEDQRNRIVALFNEAHGDDSLAKQKASMDKRKIGSWISLSEVQASELITTLVNYLTKKHAEKAAESPTVAEVAGESASDTTARAQSVNEPCTAQQIERVKQVLIQMKQVNPKVIAEYKAALAALGLTETAQFTQNECERLIVSLEAKQMEDFFSKLGAQRKANP